MLRNVIEDFLDNVRKERDFDAPFFALLSAMGFQDVQLTHGPIEKGKDFIAKSTNGRVQFAFQTKKGDLGVGDLNGGILGQLQAAAFAGYAHPAFDKDLPRQIVLVTTGILTQPACDLVSSLSADGLARIGHPPMEVWDRNKLVGLLLKYGLEGLRAMRLSDVDLSAQGRFLVLYGSVVRHVPTLADIEDYSLSWLEPTVPSQERVLIGSLESSILASKCRDSGQLYEALYCNLAALRLSMVELFLTSDARHQETLESLCHSQIDTVLSSAADYVDAVLNLWQDAGQRLDITIDSTSIFATYPMHCLRLIEALSLMALCEDREAGRAAAIGLAEFIESEPGTAHPISDRYAVSIVAACLALTRHGLSAAARSLIERSTVWLCDRFEIGAGLAHIDATVQEEVDQLLGYPFSGLNIEPERSSLLASALADLAAFLEDSKLYADVVNDIKAVEALPEYFQAADSLAQFIIDHDEVIHYPGAEFADELPGASGDLRYSSYGPYEPTSFALYGRLGILGYISISLLLRDRYFPSLWSRMINSIAGQPKT